MKPGSSRFSNIWRPILLLLIFFFFFLFGFSFSFFPDWPTKTLFRKQRFSELHVCETPGHENQGIIELKSLHTATHAFNSFKFFRFLERWIEHGLGPGKSLHMMQVAAKEAEVYAKTSSHETLHSDDSICMSLSHPQEFSILVTSVGLLHTTCDEMETTFKNYGSWRNSALLLTFGCCWLLISCTRTRKSKHGEFGNMLWSWEPWQRNIGGPIEEVTLVNV